MRTPTLPVSALASPPDDPTIWRVDDALWAQLAPLLRVDKPRKKPGRPRRADRPLLDGILWLLRTGAQWRVASSSGARDGRWEHYWLDEQGGSRQLTAYAALNIARSSADRALNCSRWIPRGTTSSILVRCRK